MNQNIEELQSELMKDKRVVEEIQRHLWIESEKAGHDIGFESAARDWISRFSQAWVEYHLPETKKKAAVKSNGASKASAAFKSFGKILKSKKS